MIAAADQGSASSILAIRRLAALWLMALAGLLASCGGGGGGGGGSAALLTFTPSVVTANIQHGQSATLTVRATAAATALLPSPLFVVIETNDVLQPAWELGTIDSHAVSATLHTQPSLATGAHRGNLRIHLCSDQQCRSEVSGSPVLLPYDLTVMPEPLQAVPSMPTSAQVAQGGQLSTSMTVTVSGPDLVWKATTATPWLQIGRGSGQGAGSFDVSYAVAATSALPVGRYTGAVTVTTSDNQRVTLDYSLNVTPVQFVLDSAVPTFTAVNGAPIEAQSLAFEFDNGVSRAWSASSSRDWLIVSPLSGTATPTTLAIRPDPSVGALASGQYGADITLRASGVTDKVVATQLTLLPPTLEANQSAITLGGLRGRDLGTGTQLTLALNTGTRTWPYSLGTLPAWLQAGASSGQVGAAGTVVDLQPRLAGVTPGSATATVNVTATVNGDIANLPLTVNLNADQRKLLPSEWAVGLTSSPVGTVLSRTLTVTDNFGGNLPWTASSDAPWLSVTPSGSTGSPSNLVLSADAQLLPADTLVQARVTLRSSDSAAQGTTVRVAAWKSATGLTTVTATPLVMPAASLGPRLVADPLRPQVYVSNGGSGIEVYHAHTGQLIDRYTNVGAALAEMSVAPDGSRLYALDTASASLAVVDLDNPQQRQTWALPAAVTAATPLLAVRPNGVELVLVGDGSVLADGSLVSTSGVNTFGYGPLAASARGSAVLTVAAVHDVDYSAMAGGMVFANRLGFLNYPAGGSSDRDVAVSPDGSQIYVANGAGLNDVPGRYFCARLNSGGSFVGALPGGAAYPNNVEVTRDGRAICGAASALGANLWVHAPSGALLATHDTGNGSLLDHQVVTTPDSMMVAALTDNVGSYSLVLVPIGR
ncbi:MAG: hypothetical protein RLY71_2531 [Pseudomonadota bacterium]|jgi:hypothetical protein